jgi:2-polyprenyl-3-methyl-5-hydroxy-6-metoxy-1,4-benzoquinol methylase
MHKGSLDIIEYFIDKYLDKSAKLTVLDIGSRDINGNFKSKFLNEYWEYTGLDITSGPNVDIVSKGPYDFGLINQYDIVISGNCLEHVEAPWKWIKQVEKVTRPGGFVCIITPFAIGIHGYPVDCYRILPDAYRYY